MTTHAWSQLARCLTIALCALLIGCAAHLGARATEGPLNRSKYLPVDGAELFLQVRTTNRRAPVVLWLHGGPGGAERPLFRYFNGELERHFVVAYWDQRGAGRSFDPEADPARLTIAQHLTDLNVVVEHLKRDFEQDRIILIGHSWGSASGFSTPSPIPRASPPSLA